MRRGWHVLAKSLWLVPSKTLKTWRLAQKTGKQCGVGFQWSYVVAAKLKDRHSAGSLWHSINALSGAGLELQVIAAVTTGRANDWIPGSACRDHPVANATAHSYTMLYLLGITDK